MEIASEAATDTSCKKRKEERVKPGKKDKTMDGFGQEQGCFSDSKRPGMKKAL
jgi:hypothetical protein